MSGLWFYISIPTAHQEVHLGDTNGFGHNAADYLSNNNLRNGSTTNNEPFQRASLAYADENGNPDGYLNPNFVSQDNLTEAKVVSNGKHREMDDDDVFDGEVTLRTKGRRKIYLKSESLVSADLHTPQEQVSREYRNLYPLNLVPEMADCGF